MARPTFAAARKVLLEGLAALGWSISSPSLKVPHATSPGGTLRLWFKPQAVYYTSTRDTNTFQVEGTRIDSTLMRHTLGEARCISYDLDIRDPDVTAVSLAAAAQLRAARDNS